MAGHSKWANIKFKKAAQDAKRGKLFTKLIREITVASRAGGADPDANPRLRAAIDKALSQNMTRDAVDRAVKRGAGDVDSDKLEEIRYEGYGPAGVAIMVDCMTDNRNRTVSEVRHAFTKHSGNLGTDGSVSYLFSKKGQIIVTNASEDQVMEVAIDAGANDVEIEEDNAISIETDPDNFILVKDALVNVGIEVQYAELTQVASNYIELIGEDSEKLQKLIDRLEDLDDVQSVYTNAEFCG